MQQTDKWVHAEKTKSACRKCSIYQTQSRSLCSQRPHVHDHCLVQYIEHVTSCKRKNWFGISCDGWGWCSWWSRVVHVPKFHSWVKSTMPLANINSDWMSNTSSDLITRAFYFASWGVRNHFTFNAPYLHFCPSSGAKTESKSTSTLNKHTCDLNCAHSLTSMQ